MQTVTYVDQPVLKRLNDKALKYDFNRALKKAFVKKLPKTVKFPLVFTLPNALSVCWIFRRQGAP